MLLADLAARSGLAMSTVSRIETGDRTPSYGALEKLAAAFGVEVRDLIPRKGRA
jgi:transcriptional regulator with XRE-family HTH domain